MKYRLSIFPALLVLSLCSCVITTQPTGPFISRLTVSQPDDPFAVDINIPGHAVHAVGGFPLTEVVIDQDSLPPSVSQEILRLYAIPETDSEVLMQQQEYKPTYEPLPLPQPGQLTPKQPDNTIRLVTYLHENDEPSGSGITIDPNLQERGAKIVTERQDGRETFQGTWRPSGAAGFWPPQEYLADGGEGHTKVAVAEDWTVRNLQAEDTVAHFDTVDGRVLVEPSNRVHLYAPRFGSVRKVEGVLGSGQITALSSSNNQVALNVDRGREQLGWTAQETAAGYARVQTQLGGVGSRKASTGATTTRGLGAFGGVDAVMLYSNWMTQTSVGGAELVYLAEGSASARAWQGVEGVKVRVGSQTPMSASSEEGAESFFQVKLDGSQTSKLRLIKVASKKAAQPGEIVEFTLRFDNVGTLPIGNVTLLDNLTTRLEYVEGSAKSSLPTGFIVEPNDAGSFTLRWEITDPLLPLQFGVVQFECRVR